MLDINLLGTALLAGAVVLAYFLKLRGRLMFGLYALVAASFAAPHFVDKEYGWVCFWVFWMIVAVVIACTEKKWLIREGK